MAADGVRARRLGRLAADERAATLCDPGTFVADHAGRVSALDGAPAGDGVVVGVGMVAGRAVTVIATDGRVHRGALGEVGGGLAARAVREAVAAGRPVALLLDADGARQVEGVPAVLASAEWLAALADASGHVPLVAAVLGIAGGAAAYGAALCDQVVMLAGRSFAFVAGPPVVAAALSEQSDLEVLGGSRLHAATSGLAHLVAGDDRGALAALVKILSYLPSAAWTTPPEAATAAPARDGFALAPASVPMDVVPVVHALVDQDSLLELGAGFGASVMTALARVDGRAVALVASQPAVLGGAIDHAAAQKLARFVRFAAAFNLPIVTLCDTPGFLPGRAEEARRLLVHGAKVISAYAEARRSVPLVALVLRRAVGAGAVLAYGADVVLACPGAEIVQMGAAAARAARPEGGPPHVEGPSDPEATGFAHRTIDPRYARAELVRTLARVRAPIAASPGRRKHCLVPL